MTDHQRVPGTAFVLVPLDPNRSFIAEPFPGCSLKKRCRHREVISYLFGTHAGHIERFRAGIAKWHENTNMSFRFPQPSNEDDFELFCLRFLRELWKCPTL